MTGVRHWLVFAYRMPRTPSTPRTSVWRRLRRLGVAQLQDGLVALPLDARNREQLEWLADEVLDAGGSASLWIAEQTSADEERRLIERMTEAVAAEYRLVIEAAQAALTDPAPARARLLRRLRRDMRSIGGRDYFPSPAREEARRALDDLAEQSEVPS